MRTELILKFSFEASHSLVGYETPHPHFWTLQVSITGSPQDGRIVDMVELRTKIQERLNPIQSSFLNESTEVDQQVRQFPTCESLCHFFFNEMNQIIEIHFSPKNPSLRLYSIEVTIADMNGSETGAARMTI